MLGATSTEAAGALRDPARVALHSPGLGLGYFEALGAAMNFFRNFFSNSK